MKGGILTMLKVQLTERDMNLLKYIAEYGVISIKTAGDIYQTKSYHDNRIALLSSAGYVNRSNGIKLASKGRKVLKELGVEIRHVPRKASHQQRAARMSELGTVFKDSGVDFIPSWQAKELYNLRANSKAYGVLRNDIITMIYGISENTQPKSIKHIKTEISELQEYGISRAVILAESKKAMDMYEIEAHGLSEQLLLPWNDLGIGLLKQHIKANLCYKAAVLALKKVNPSQWALADYSDEAGNSVIVVVLNDIEKRAKLHGYYYMSQHRHTSTQQVILICLESQVSLFTQEYPKARILSVPEVKLLQKEV